MSEQMLNDLLTGWEGALVGRAIIGFIGLVLSVLALRSLIRTRRGWIAAVIWLILGAVAIAFAAAPQAIITNVIRTEYVLRIRIVFGMTSILVLLVTLDSVRRHQLAERYALLWVATGVVLLFVVLFPAAVDLLRAATGLEFGSAMAALAFIFLVLVCFHFSLSMSSLRAKQVRLAQRLAILEAQLRADRAGRQTDQAGDAAHSRGQSPHGDD